MATLTTPQSKFDEALLASIRDIPDFPKPGITFKDITPLLGNESVRKYAVESLLSKIRKETNHLEIQAIAGIESRGFLLGMSLADRLEIPFVPIRKVGKLPYKKISKAYDLEYGSAVIEMHEDAVKPKMRVLIHDDLLATGGTVCAAAELIQEAGAEVIGFAFLIELLQLGGINKIKKYSQAPVISLVQY